MKTRHIIVLLIFSTVLFAQEKEGKIINNLEDEISTSAKIEQISKFSSSNSSAAVVTYDFTTGSDKYFGGTSAAIEVETGVWAMIAGDANGDGEVDYTNDILNTWSPSFGVSGYQQADLDLGGDVDYAQDILIKWSHNFGKETLVP